MNQHHPYRATILPVSEGASRPLWSVMIPTYNCAHYLRETLASVLEQDPGIERMQIEVVDDCSTLDDPESVVKELGQGRVSFYRQPENVGYIRNFETCLQRSRGQLIHLLHGDDCVSARFYHTMQSAFENNQQIGAAFCRHMVMDERGHWQAISPLDQVESGILKNWLERMAARQLVQTPSIVVRRNVYEELGGFDRRISCNGEDWEMWVRIAKYYPIWYEVEPLALYRVHLSSLSGNSIRTGENIRDVRKVIDIIKQYLPPEKADSISSQSLKFYAMEALNYARKLAIEGDLKAAISQIQEALKCHSSPKVIYSCMKLFSAQVLFH